MGGFNADLLRQNLKIPSTMDPVVILAIGYPGDAQTLPDHLKIRELAPRERYIQQEFVMNKSF